jgi:GT2 family glycosyltransferase
MTPKVYIVIVNYNGFKDTLECLESVFRNDYLNYHVIVVDNDSKDKSVDQICNWAEGKTNIPSSSENILSTFSNPPIPKPLKYNLVSGDELDNLHASDSKSNLSIISLSANRGFASGNNVGIKYAQTFNDAEYIWLLNNDTVIESHALSKLVAFATSSLTTSKKTGIISSKIKFYNKPNCLQAVGAVFNKWTASNYQIGLGEIDNGQYDKTEIKFDYVVGASMFVNANFIKDVGLMCEDYFLYFEELDWSTRGKTLGWTSAYCSDSIVYHKLGVSTGQHGQFYSFYTSNKYAIKSLFLFYRKFYPNLVLMARFRLVYTALKFLMQGKKDNFRYIISRAF